MAIPEPHIGYQSHVQSQGRPTAIRIPHPAVKANDHCAFSFKYWRQIDYFGLQSVKGEQPISNSWVVSLLERLQELELQPIDVLLSNNRGLRTHDTKWDLRNVPFVRTDLTWLPECVASNHDEFPIRQFHVSKALGRVVGFISGNTFFVVLLDPLHNSQPSSFNAYEVRECLPLSSAMESFLCKAKPHLPPHLIEEAQALHSMDMVVMRLDPEVFANLITFLGQDMDKQEDLLLRFENWLDGQKTN